MLAPGRIDLAIGSEPDIARDVARLGLKETLERTPRTPPDSTRLYVAIPLNSAVLSLLDRVDAVLKAMLADGTLAALLANCRQPLRVSDRPRTDFRVATARPRA